jgi:lipopolysaccharide/colanic/teichoic acid biosynthesis glycosyltransferase
MSQPCPYPTIAPRRLTQRAAKRAIDVAGALVGLVLTAPILGVAAIAIWRTMGRPIFYSQARPGRNERVFRVHKLRTMIDEARPDGTVIVDADRVTPLGRALRRTSVDEIPQLWNVVKGEMSLVGPRPLLCEYLPHYSPTQRRRHEVRPGITGLAQVQRHAITSWDDQFALDVSYVDNASLGLDLKIIGATLTDSLLVWRRNRPDYSMVSLSTTTDGETKFRGSKPAEIDS